MNNYSLKLHFSYITFFAKDLAFGLEGMYFISQYTNLHETTVSGSKLMLDTIKLRVTTLIIAMTSKVKIPKLYYLSYGYLHRKKSFFFFLLYISFLLIMRENYLKFIEIECCNESVNKSLIVEWICLCIFYLKTLIFHFKTLTLNSSENNNLNCKLFEVQLKFF